MKTVNRTVLKVRRLAQLMRRLNPVVRMAAVFTVLAAASASAQAPLDVRVALIIGNSAYPASPLLNPSNDAKAMGEVLRKLGFQVIELRDGSKAQMQAAIAQLNDSLKGKQGVGMLYYAGHGLQLDWHNYMVPVDASLKTAADVQKQTVDLNNVVDLFKTAGNRMNIVVMDACRDNPFGASTSSAKGLAQLDAPPSTFLAYATAPGNVAEDGDEKSGNGLYTQYLLLELKRPIVKIEDVFKRVRLNVRKQSQGRQIPWESTSLEDDFYFNDGAKYTIKPEELERMAGATTAAQLASLKEAQRLAALTSLAEQIKNKEQLREAEFKQEKTAWERIKASANADDFYGFMQAFPSAGELGEMAQLRLNQISKPKITASLGQGQDASLAYAGERFKVGDEFEIQTSDVFTNLRGASITARVTAIEGDVVQINDGAILASTLGAAIKNERGSYDPPMGGFPVDLQIGKKWSADSVRKQPSGGTLEVRIESKISGRETITVPAGTFQTYVVETQFLMSDASSILRKAWVDPRYGFPIKSEEIGRKKKKVFRAERTELMSIKAMRS